MSHSLSLSLSVVMMMEWRVLDRGKETREEERGGGERKRERR
jgi:hypothetical protein